MSKIALKANDSGTGTFEIQAPATNTNRVLELPDEAGKVLTTGNSDPAEVFKQSNILGTVSATGTYPNLVPTGAIMESGSNANGDFVKYADGTLICKLTPFTFSGWAFVGSQNNKSLPHNSVFITSSTTRSFVSASTIPTSNSYPVLTAFQSNSSTISLRSTVNPGSQFIFMIFIGRWF